MSRQWENWDVNGIASKIESIWQDHPSERAHREQLVDLVSRHVGGGHTSVLEVGCGTGLVYEGLMASLGTKVEYTGVDVSVKMLEIARRKFPEAQFLYGDGYGLVFDDGEFDVVLSFEVLGHIPEIGPFLKELLRTAKTTCIFTAWPSDRDDIVEDHDVIDGVSFLQRQYSDPYVRRVVGAALRERRHDIEVVTLGPGRLAYVVTLA